MPELSDQEVTTIVSALRWEKKTKDIDPKVYKLWMSKHITLLVAFCHQEVEYLGQFPNILTFENAQRYNFDPKHTDISHTIFLLARYVYCYDWPSDTLEAGAVELFCAVLRLDKAIEELCVPINLRCCILSALYKLTRPATGSSTPRITSKVLEAMSYIISMMDEHPQDFFAPSRDNEELAGLFYLAEADYFHLIGPTFSTPVAERVKLYGLFLSSTQASVELWSGALNMSELTFGPEDAVTFFGKVDIHSVSRYFLQRIDRPPEDPDEHTREFVVPLRKLMVSGHVPVRDEFWGKVAEPLIDRHWLRFKNVKYESTSLELLNHRNIVFDMLCCVLGPSMWSDGQFHDVCKVFVRTDIVLLIARHLILCILNSDYHSYVSCRGLMEAIMLWANAYRATETPNPVESILKPSMESIFLSTLDNMRVLQPLKSRKKLLPETSEPRIPLERTSVISSWCQLGEVLGVEETIVRASRIEELSKSRGGLVGCGWRKCPLFSLPSTTTMLLCSGCFKVQYCADSHCQKRDWEGGHKGECSGFRSPEMKRS